MEAENYYGSTKDNLGHWSVANDASCSGQRCARSSSPSSAEYGPERGPLAAYSIRPAKPGPLYGWALAAGGAFSYGLLGEPVAGTVKTTSTAWRWYRLPTPIPVETAGARVFCLRVVAGGSVDRLVLSPDPKYMPHGAFGQAAERPDTPGAEKPRPPGAGDVDPDLGP
jgi:hypothetical protein